MDVDVERDLRERIMALVADRAAHNGGWISRSDLLGHAGKDTDTVAAKAGAELDARSGTNAVPTAWRDLVHGIGGRRAGVLLSVAASTQE